MGSFAEVCPDLIISGCVLEMALRQPKRRKANNCNVSVTVGLSLNIKNTIHIAFHFPTFYYIDSQLLCIEISNNVIGLVQNYW